MQCNLANKIIHFCKQIEHIQKRCKEQKEGHKTRVFILEYLFEKTKKKVQVNLFHAKKIKLEKKLREVKPEIF